MKQSLAESRISVWREILLLAIPSVLQTLLSNSFAFIDVLMVGHLGDRAIAAVAIAGQISFFLGMCLSAIYGMTAFITQFHGGGDRKNIARTQGLMLVSSLAVSILFFVGIRAFDTNVLSLFSKDPVVIDYGTQFMAIIVYVFVVNAVKDSYANTLGAIGKLKLNIAIGVIGMVINTFFNYVLIYGHLSFPELGIKGAAIATLIASVVSALGLLGYIYVKRHFVNTGLKELLSFDLPFTKTIYRTTLPLLAHEGMWSLGNMLYAIAFGYLGTEALASYELGRTFNGYFMMGIFGVAYAARVIIGKALSRKEPREAMELARLFTRLSVFSALGFGVLLFVLNPLLLGLFGEISPETTAAFARILYIQAFVLLANFLNNVWIVGTFGAGGDNAYTLKLIMITTWCITLPLVFAGSYLFHWSITTVYLLFSLEEVCKAFIGYFRYRSGKWANNLAEKF